MLLLVGLVAGLTLWGFYTSVGGRLWAGDALTVGAPTSARP